MDAFGTRSRLRSVVKSGGLGEGARPRVVLWIATSHVSRVRGLGGGVCDLRP